VDAIQDETEDRQAAFRGRLAPTIEVHRPMEFGFE
jgi:hypothetical protein